MRENIDIQAVARINYTSEDIKVLVELASNYKSLMTNYAYIQREFLGVYIIQREFLGVEYKDYPLTLHKVILSLGDSQREFVYTVPYYNIPLYVNSGSLHLFVRWRLELVNE